MIMAVCKTPKLQLKVLNRRNITHIYMEMETVIRKLTNANS